MLSGIFVELPWLAPIFKFLLPRERLRQEGAAAIRASQTLGKDGSIVEGRTLFSKMMSAGSEQILSLPQIHREASNLIVAGSETTASTLTYLVWAILSADPTMTHRLRQEVNTLQPGFTSAEASALPFLNRVIQETLRLYGAAPGEC